MGSESQFRPAARDNSSILARAEKAALVAMARRLPPWIHFDHLTAIGFLALPAVCLCYWVSRTWPPALLIANLFLLLNWFGDSLDGTLARVRNRQRPRYGFYLDHILDACGSVFLFAGLALSGYMSERIAVGLLVAYFLVSIEVYLATYTVGTFHLSIFAFGPTELRLLLITGNIALLFKPLVKLAGNTYPLFDVGGGIGIAGLLCALLYSIVKHTILLYRAEALS